MRDGNHAIELWHGSQSDIDMLESIEIRRAFVYRVSVSVKGEQNACVAIL